MTYILNVYVIHAKNLSIRTSLCERLHSMLDDVKQLQVQFQFVESMDPAEIMKENPNQYVNLDPTKEEGFEDFDKMLRPLSLPCLSNALKHLRVYKAIRDAEANEHEFNLVLEDDACYPDAIADQLLAFIKKIPALAGNDWDLLFLGFPHPTPEEGKEAPTIQNPQCTPVTDIYRILPGADSYFVSKKGATALANAFSPIKWVTNAQLSYMIHKNQLKAYVCNPNLFVDGSKLGVYVSVLNPNNVLIYNANFKELYSLVHNKNAYTEEDAALFDRLWEENKFKQHPDYLYVKGLYLIKSRRFQEARQVMDEVFQLYKQNDCPINKDSVFLNNFIELFKVLQPDVL